VNSLAIHTLYGIDDDLARRRFRWIIRTQNGDGGWGYFGDSTPEETAYVLEALLIWDRHVERLEPTILDRAAKYLQQRLHTPFYTPLWIGKSLYSPRHLIKAAVLSALHSHFNRD
jgi:hypothetical protein